jgi:hypothetical protein
MQAPLVPAALALLVAAMAKPLPFSTQEINDSIMAGFAMFQDDQKKVKETLGAADDMAVLGALWKSMTPGAKDAIKNANPQVHKQATSMFGG